MTSSTYSDSLLRSHTPAYTFIKTRKTTVFTFTGDTLYLFTGFVSNLSPYLPKVQNHGLYQVGIMVQSKMTIGVNVRMNGCMSLYVWV